MHTVDVSRPRVEEAECVSGRAQVVRTVNTASAILANLVSRETPHFCINTFCSADNTKSVRVSVAQFEIVVKKLDHDHAASARKAVVESPIMETNVARVIRVRAVIPFLSRSEHEGATDAET